MRSASTCLPTELPPESPARAFDLAPPARAARDAPPATAPDASLCFHCGQPPAPGHAPLHAVVDGATRLFCCGGCQALACTLHAAGFGHLYGDAFRFGRPMDDASRREAEPIWAAYDTEELRAQFVRSLDDARAEITLAPENIRCAACAWLIEQQLMRLPGVESAIANVATRRVLVRWRTAEQRVSCLLGAMADIGYPAWPFEVSRSDRQDRAARRALLLRLAVAMLGMMQVMMYAWPIYSHEGTIDAGQLALMRWASLALTLPVVLYSASPVFAGAWRDLRRGRVGMDLPVALGVAAGFLASVVATARGQGEVYFDSVTMFVAFLLTARYLELRMRQASRSGAEMLARQLPASCERLAENGGTATEHAGRVPVARLRAGDVIRVRAGDIVPADGTVLHGASDLDESMLTGESRLLPRAAGDPVLAGCLNASSPLEIRVERIGANTRLAGIVAMLDRALAEKPRLAALTDRVAAWFVATLLVLAAATGVIWWCIDPARAGYVAVAVLVVSCPCALSLATPAALAAAGATLSRRGLLLTRGHALEALASVTDVVIDKTGTLTEGRLSMVAIEPHGTLDAAQCLALAAALERTGEHPIARAIVAAQACRQAEGRGAHAFVNGVVNRSIDGFRSPKEIAALRNVPGQGIDATADGRRVRLGRRAFVMGLQRRDDDAQPDRGDAARNDDSNDSVGNSENVGSVDGDRDDGATPVWLGDESGPLARFVLSDVARVEASALVAGLRVLGVRSHLVSGDSAGAVRWWASHFGIRRAAGAVTPAGKREYVKRLQQRGAVVLAVGDGINDAPVLAQAQVSIAIGSGAPLAQAGADAVLTHGGIGEIARALALARDTRRIVRQNLAWAFAYNVIAIPLAATGHVTAWMAGIGMSLSSLLVVLNAWRLLRRPEGR